MWQCETLTCTILLLGLSLLYNVHSYSRVTFLWVGLQFPPPPPPYEIYLSPGSRSLFELGCNRGSQPFSHSHHLVGTLVLHNMRLTLHTGLCATRNASVNSAVTHQRSNHSNNKRSCHLVGTLTSHWQLLYLWHISNSLKYMKYNVTISREQ